LDVTLARLRGDRRRVGLPDGGRAVTSQDPARATDDVEDKVLAEQCRVFYHHSRTALIGNLVAAAAMVALFWDNESNSSAIVGWSVSVGVFSIVRWVIYRRFDASVADPSTARGWARAFLALTAASGVIWGALSLVAFDPADQAGSFYVVFAVICMAGAGLGALAAYGPALVSFLLLAIVPLIVSGFLSGVETYVVVAATLTFLLFVLVRFGLSWERTLRDQIRDRLEKELLLDQARERTNMAELLELTLANIDQGVIVRDADDNIVLFNDRLAELLDVPREFYERNASSEELNAYHDRMGDFEFLNENLAETLRKWQQRRAAGIPIERLSYERKDRMGRWLHAVRQPMPNGMEVRTFLDITERKSAEESALEKARLLETTLESMGQGLTMYDADWKLVSYNSRYLEHFDMPADMFAGENTFDDVVGATMRQDYGEDWRSRLQVVRDPTRMTDVWRRSFARPTGRWLDLLSVPVPTGGFVVTSTDMTEQKKAESELRRQQTINETVLDAMDQGLLMIDGDGRYLLYNKKLCDLIDLPEELLATYPTHADVTAFQLERGDFDHLSEEDRDRLHAEASRLETTREPFVYERVGPGGRALEIRNNPLPDGGWVRIWTDVTARKQAEREVAEKQRQLELTLENMEQGIILLDENDRTILFNEKASTLLGVPREMLDGGATSEEFVDYQRARGEFDKVDPSLWQAMAVIIEEQKRGVIKPFEYERQRQDGSWLHVLNKPVESGGWLRTYRDVTEAKQAEERIRRARDEAEATERKLRDIVAALPIGVAVFDETLGIDLWNQAYCDLAGLTHEQVEGNRAFHDNTRLIYENSSASRRVPLERFAEEREERFRGGRRFVGEFSFLRPYVDVQYSLSPLGDGGVLYASVDITSQKQAQREAIRARDEARTAQANLQGIIDRLPVGVLVFDEELQIVLWNHVFLDYVAIAEEEMRELVTFDGLWRFLYTNFPQYQDIPFERFMQEKRDEYLGEGTVLIERQHVHPPRDTQQIVAPLPNGGRVVAATDISVQKRAEREALEAKETAEEATRAKSAFLAAMSHEIRTPMNGVFGMIEVLEQSSLDADQRSITQTVRDSAISLLTIIDDILDFSKIEAGELRIDEVPLSVRDLAESALDIIGGVATAKGLDVALSADPAVAETISADPVRLRQILLNLLGNAVKFTETGSILLEIEVLETAGLDPDEMKAGAGRQHLRFAVTDTGIGIPEERLSGLFEAFRQAEASTTRRFGGTGLGLSICKRLVELMDGEIGVESDPGVGSSFWFTLSLAVPRRRSPPVASSSSSRTMRRIASWFSDSSRSWATRPRWPRTARRRWSCGAAPRSRSS
jgi:PAS domain S-box-containing protein